MKESKMKTTARIAAAACAGALFLSGCDPEEMPKFVTGAEKIDQWRVDEKGWWHAQLPAGTKSSHFFVNGQRRLRPCVPRKGWFYMDDLAVQTNAEKQVFRARDGQIDASWGMEGVEACLVQAWMMIRAPVESYDAETRVVTCGSAPKKGSWVRFDRRHWYRLENVKEAFGEPGDWYLDKSGELVYAPLPGEDPATAEAYLAVRDHALVIEGMTNVVVKGVTFAYTGWNMPEGGQTFSQAGANASAAVVVRNSKNVRFENCAFKHTGGWGLEFGPGAVDCAAVGCEFYDLGAGGVKIGCAWDGAEDPRNWASGCVVEQCVVEHGGRFEPAGVGLWIGNANHCRLSRNTIRDMYYSGISCGWKWDRKPSGAHHNLIEFNDISDIGQRRLMDMGGIYTLGEQPGTKVVGNSIREVTTTRGCGFALYFDQGSSFIEAVSNYVARGEFGNFFLQYNTASNVVADNVFVCGRDIMLRHSADRKHPTFPTELRNNVFWWDDPNTVLQLHGEWNDDYFASEGNTYFIAGSPLAPVLPGFHRVEMPKPLPPKGVGRSAPPALTASLPAVPEVFPPAPDPEALGDAVGAALSNEFVDVVFDGKGCVSSIREKATGRELVGEKVPFMSVRLADGTTVAPEALRSETGRYLNFIFPGGMGECWLEVRPFDGGWTFRTIKVGVKDAADIVLGRIVPSCNKSKGSMSNIVMDDRSAVVLRAYQPELEMNEAKIEGQSENYDQSRDTLVRATRQLGFFDRVFGLAAGPADRILDMLKRMAEAADMTKTGCGGPWSMEADANRCSYLFATWPDLQSMDDWLRLADKAGCQTLHFHVWWKTRGSYQADPPCFKDDEELAEAVERVHAYGKKASTHTLSAAIQFGDPLIDPKWFADFVSDAEYKLAKPYLAGDTELFVDSKPVKKHAKILTGSTNGNILRIGDDLLQYDDFTTEPPYKFTGVHIAREPYGEAATYDDTQALQTGIALNAADGKRERKLSRVSYPAGTRVSYLHQRYAELYAQPGSLLAEVATDRIAEFYNGCGFDGIYFDGAEGMGTRYGIDWLRERTLGKLGKRFGSIINSTSCRNPFNWWHRSLVGTWDHPNYGPRSFHDRHIYVNRDLCAADFLRSDLGWWNAHAADANSRGYFPEEMEYFGCKTAANDMTMSIMGARPTDGPIKFSMDDQLTILGWWERARYARAFKPGLQDRMKRRGDEFRLRQDGSGEWRVTPFTSHRHRVATRDFAKWTVDCAADAPAELRVESLYAADHAATNAAIRVLDATMAAELSTSTAPGVKVAFERAHDADRGDTLKIRASNASAPEDGSWACVSRQLPEKTFLAVNPVSTLWVQGDGSGATLNVQVRKARAFGNACSENLVKLDFTGWRRVDLLLRERDADESAEFDWPYVDRSALNTQAAVARSTISGKTVGSFNFYLNGIPQGKSAEVEVGAWDSIPLKRAVLEKGATVTLGGKALHVPFDLPGGDYAELKDGAWTHYAESGEPLERIVATNAALRVAKGSNEVSFDGTADGAFARAEVTVFAVGEPEPAFAPLSAEQKKLLAVEYELPCILNPLRGLVGRSAVRVRPGEKALLCFEILGPARYPVVDGRRLPVVLKDKYDKVGCYDGVNWSAVRIRPGSTGYENRLEAAYRESLGEGTLSKPFDPLKPGTTELEFSDDYGAGARVTFFKKYVSE